jgi:hypothetical protein
MSGETALFPLITLFSVERFAKKVAENKGRFSAGCKTELQKKGISILQQIQLSAPQVVATEKVKYR